MKTRMREEIECCECVVCGNNIDPETDYVCVPEVGDTAEEDTYICENCYSEGTLTCPECDGILETIEDMFDLV